MDRRTILAVFLAILVLIVYQFAFAPDPQKADRSNEIPAQRAAGDNDETDSPRRSPGSDSPDPDFGSGDGLGTNLENAEIGAAPPHATPGETSPSNLLLAESTTLSPAAIVTNSYRAEIDPVGGTISSWRLEEYTDQLGAPAELVPNPAGLFDLELVGDDGRVDLRQIPFLLEHVSEYQLRLSASHPDGWGVVMDYVFDPESYLVDFDITVEGLPNRRGDAELVLTYPMPMPALEKSEKAEEQARGSVSLVDDKLTKHRIHGKKEGWSESGEGLIHWAGVRSKYFISAIVPDEGIYGAVRMWAPRNEDNVHTEIRLPLEQNGNAHLGFQIYSGPMEFARLQAKGVGLEKAVDLGWKLIIPFSRLLLVCMNFIHQFIPNYGIVILIFSIATKLLFWPLTQKSMESMKGMQKLKPEMDKLNELYKDDAQRKQQAMLELYKKHNINPVKGCLPVVIQMPVFVALYSVLSNSIELRKEPFVWWINDLSAPDVVGAVMGFPIHILPVLMALSMLVQHRLTPTDPRQAAIGYLMPVMMLVFFYMLPSGLVFYWTVNNALQIGQQLMMNRESKQQLAAA